MSHSIAYLAGLVTAYALYAVVVSLLLNLLLKIKKGKRFEAFTWLNVLFVIGIFGTVNPDQVHNSGIVAGVLLFWLAFYKFDQWSDELGG